MAISQTDDAYHIKHKKATLSGVFLLRASGADYTNPPMQFGLSGKNIIKGGNGLYLYGNRTKFKDNYSSEFSALEKNKGSLTYGEYQKQLSALNDKASKSAAMIYLNAGINHNFYNYSKVPVVLNVGVNVIAYSGTKSTNTQGKINLDAGINVFIPSKKKVEVGFIAYFNFYEMKELKSYFGIMLGFKL